VGSTDRDCAICGAGMAGAALWTEAAEESVSLKYVKTLKR
jgi:hypothetical protein